MPDSIQKLILDNVKANQTAARWVIDVTNIEKSSIDAVVKLLTDHQLKVELLQSDQQTPYLILGITAPTMEFLEKREILQTTNSADNQWIEELFAAMNYLKKPQVLPKETVVDPQAVEAPEDWETNPGPITPNEELSSEEQKRINQEIQQEIQKKIIESTQVSKNIAVGTSPIQASLASRSAEVSTPPSGLKPFSIDSWEFASPDGAEQQVPQETQTQTDLALIQQSILKKIKADPLASSWGDISITHIKESARAELIELLTSNGFNYKLKTPTEVFDKEIFLSITAPTPDFLNNRPILSTETSADEQWVVELFTAIRQGQDNFFKEFEDSLEKGVQLEASSINNFIARSNWKEKLVERFSPEAIVLLLQDNLILAKEFLKDENLVNNLLISLAEDDDTYINLAAIFLKHLENRDFVEFAKNNSICKQILKSVVIHVPDLLKKTKFLTVLNTYLSPNDIKILRDEAEKTLLAKNILLESASNIETEDVIFKKKNNEEVVKIFKKHLGEDKVQGLLIGFDTQSKDKVAKLLKSDSNSDKQLKNLIHAVKNNQNDAQSILFAYLADNKLASLLTPLQIVEIIASHSEPNILKRIINSSSSEFLNTVLSEVRKFGYESKLIDLLSNNEAKKIIDKSPNLKAFFDKLTAKQAAVAQVDKQGEPAAIQEPSVKIAKEFIAALKQAEHFIPYLDTQATVIEAAIEAAKSNAIHKAALLWAAKRDQNTALALLQTAYAKFTRDIDGNSVAPIASIQEIAEILASHSAKAEFLTGVFPAKETQFTVNSLLNLLQDEGAASVIQNNAELKEFVGSTFSKQDNFHLLLKSSNANAVASALKLCLETEVFKDMLKENLMKQTLIVKKAIENKPLAEVIINASKTFSEKIFSDEQINEVSAVHNLSDKPTTEVGPEKPTTDESVTEEKVVTVSSADTPSAVAVSSSTTEEEEHKALLKALYSDQVDAEKALTIAENRSRLVQFLTPVEITNVFAVHSWNEKFREKISADADCCELLTDLANKDQKAAQILCKALGLDDETLTALLVVKSKLTTVWKQLDASFDQSRPSRQEPVTEIEKAKLALEQTNELLGTTESKLTANTALLPADQATLIKNIQELREKISNKLAYIEKYKQDKEKQHHELIEAAQTARAFPYPTQANPPDLPPRKFADEVNTFLELVENILATVSRNLNPEYPVSPFNSEELRAELNQAGKVLDQAHEKLLLNQDSAGFLNLTNKILDLRKKLNKTVESLNEKLEQIKKTEDVNSDKPSMLEDSVLDSLAEWLTQTLLEIGKDIVAIKYMLAAAIKNLAASNKPASSEQKSENMSQKTSRFLEKAKTLDAKQVAELFVKQQNDPEFLTDCLNDDINAPIKAVLVGAAQKDINAAEILLLSYCAQGIDSKQVILADAEKYGKPILDDAQITEVLTTYLIGAPKNSLFLQNPAIQSLIQTYLVAPAKDIVEIFEKHSDEIFSPQNNEAAIRLLTVFANSDLAQKSAGTKIATQLITLSQNNKNKVADSDAVLDQIVTIATKNRTVAEILLNAYKTKLDESNKRALATSQPLQDVKPGLGEEKTISIDEQPLAETSQQSRNVLQQLTAEQFIAILASHSSLAAADFLLGAFKNQDFCNEVSRLMQEKNLVATPMVKRLNEHLKSNKQASASLVANFQEGMSFAQSPLSLAGHFQALDILREMQSSANAVDNNAVDNKVAANLFKAILLDEGFKNENFWTIKEKIQRIVANNPAAKQVLLDLCAQKAEDTSKKYLELLTPELLADYPDKNELATEVAEYHENKTALIQLIRVVDQHLSQLGANAEKYQLTPKQLEALTAVKKVRDNAINYKWKPNEARAILIGCLAEHNEVLKSKAPSMEARKAAAKPTFFKPVVSPPKEILDVDAVFKSLTISEVEQNSAKSAYTDYARELETSSTAGLRV